jgi:putative SOS response-associated peptidase YedK
MCGRYTLTSHPDDLRVEFGLPAVPPEYVPRYNIAPSQPVPALVTGRAGGDDAPRWVSLRWGLAPAWMPELRVGQKMINARAETVATNPAFRRAFQRRRCLVLADGFYEWRRLADAKVPMRIRRADGRPFAFAGIWERRPGENGEPVATCAIITTEANPFMRRIHDRMPVLLSSGEYARWLDPAATAEPLLELLRPCADDVLDAYAVSPIVNSPRNDVPACIAPV